MMLSAAGVVKVRNSRKGTGRTANQGRDLRAITSKVLPRAMFGRTDCPTGAGRLPRVRTPFR